MKCWGLNLGPVHGRQTCHQLSYIFYYILFIYFAHATTQMWRLKDNLESDHAGIEIRLGSRHLNLIPHLARVTAGQKLSTAPFTQLNGANFWSPGTRENPVTPRGGPLSELFPSAP